jgi:hypothetical protein
MLNTIEKLKSSDGYNVDASPATRDKINEIISTVNLLVEMRNNDENAKNSPYHLFTAMERLASGR